MRYPIGGNGDSAQRYEQLRQMRPEELIKTAEAFSRGDRRKQRSMMMSGDRDHVSATVAAARKRYSAEMKTARRAGDENRIQQLQ